MTDNERKELLLKAKPILFNTEMVTAIQNGWKTVTRRVIKPYERIPKDAVFGYTAFTPEGHISTRGGFTGKKGEERYGENFIKMPYLPGDILYVRETWGTYSVCEGIMPKIYYKADGNTPDKIKWKPSIHMPKEAARIFLRVTDVRVERLQDITAEQIDAEGCKEYAYSTKTGELLPSKPTWFSILWDSTIKKSDLDKYRWAVNPWVWVISFERVGVK